MALWKVHPLEEIRKSANVSQMELAARSGINQSKISLIENHLLVPTPEQQKKLGQCIYAIAAERAQAVARVDPSLQEAMRKIRSNPSKQKLYERFRADGLSEAESARKLLGRAYPGRAWTEPVGERGDTREY
jgi:transcriptional regulator with XRE-family HTH domain